MAERNVIRFLLITGATLLAMGSLAQLIPELLEIPVGYGIVVSGSGLAVILFAWHVWVQTSPGGVDLEGYNERTVSDRLVDFVILVAVSGAVTAVGAVIGIESGAIASDELWGEDLSTIIAPTIVVVIGMAAGIYAALRRNSDIRIRRETGRGE